MDSNKNRKWCHCIGCQMQPNERLGPILRNFFDFSVISPSSFCPKMYLQSHLHLEKKCIMTLSLSLSLSPLSFCIPSLFVPNLRPLFSATFGIYGHPNAVDFKLKSLFFCYATHHHSQTPGRSPIHPLIRPNVA